MKNSLESRAFSGGIILVGRQFFGIVLSLVGMLVTTRLLGPHQYGQFVIVSGVSGYITNIAKLGLDVYLIRHQGELSQLKIGVTQALYIIICFISIILTGLLGQLVGYWYEDQFLCNLLWSYVLIIPIILMSSIPIAMLDRQLRYKEAAMTEFVGQLTYLLFSVSIVCVSRSVWGVIVGTFAQALVILVLATCLSKVRFSPRWSLIEAKKQIGYGVGYSASIWIWQARDLVNPVIVGKILGSEATAFVAMAIRLAGLVGFAKTAVWRVYMSFLARMADDREKMKEAIKTGISHQVLITGLSFILFLVLSPNLIQMMMGPKWMPVMEVFPFIAAGIVLNSGFSLYSSGLYIIGKNQDVSFFHIIHICLFLCSAWLFLIMHRNVVSYGYAEIVAFCSYLSIRNSFRKHLFKFSEYTLYINLLLVFSAITLITLFLHKSLIYRAIIGTIFILIIVFVVPLNRANSLSVIKLLRQRLVMSNA